MNIHFTNKPKTEEVISRADALLNVLNKKGLRSLFSPPNSIEKQPITLDQEETIIGLLNTSRKTPERVLNLQNEANKMKTLVMPKDAKGVFAKLQIVRESSWWQRVRTRVFHGPEASVNDSFTHLLKPNSPYRLKRIVLPAALRSFRFSHKRVTQKLASGVMKVSVSPVYGLSTFETYNQNSISSLLAISNSPDKKFDCFLRKSEVLGSTFLRTSLSRSERARFSRGLGKKKFSSIANEIVRRAERNLNLFFPTVASKSGR